ncbi:phage tail protein [uncultured Ruegeria sp.]|uniref:phage tail protein n=1 Tax=uncultured Ruegeria sp. TaxID=259304 RepID=UPI002627DE38|nr:phage tail protein [uncultured Ruegeria sp.]
MPQVGLAIGAIGTTIAAGGVGAAAIQLGGSLLLSAASRALMPKPDYSSNQVRGRQVSSRQPVAARELVYGLSRKGGTIVFLHSTDATYGGGQENAILHVIIVLASHEVSGIGAVYFDGVRAFDSGSTTARGRWEGRAFCYRRLGTENQSVAPQVGNFTNGLWSDDHRLYGCAYIALRLLYSPEAFPSGLPNITANVGGKNDILDPRTGLRGYTDNAALCLADYMSLSPYGLGAEIGAVDGINSDALIAAANVCDENVIEADGSTDARYRCNGVVTLDQAPKTAIEAMLTSMAGQAAWQAGQWHIYAGAYRTPTLSFTSDDFAGDLRLQTRRSQQDNFNGVRGQFISTASNWQPDDFPAYQSSVYLAEDGGEEKWDDISLPFTNSGNAAQRLAKIHLERKRRQQRVTVPGKLNMWQATVGSNVNLTYDRFGFALKPFEVQGVTLSIQDGALVPELVLQETSPLVYDHTASEFEIYEAAPETSLPSVADIPPPTGVTIDESLYQTRNSGGLKTQVTVAWEAASSVFVAQYQVEASSDNGVNWQVLGRTSQTFFDARDWQAGDWQWRVKAISNLGVSSDYTTAIQAIYGLSELPSAISGLRIQRASGTAILSWGLHPDLDVQIGGQILIRHSTAASPSWLTSRSYSETSGGQTSDAVPLLAGTYLVRAQDSSGNLGPVSSVLTADAETVEFAALTTLIEDSSFTGTKTDCGVVGSALQLAGSGIVSEWDLVSDIERVSSAGGYKTSGTYEFAAGMDFGSVRSVRLSADIDTLTGSLTDLISERQGFVSTWQQISSGSGGETDVFIEARTTEDDPAGSPTWSEWSRVDRSDVIARGVEAIAILSSIDSTFTPVVSRLRLTADEVA